MCRITITEGLQKGENPHIFLSLTTMSVFTFCSELFLFCWGLTLHAAFESTMHCTTVLDITVNNMYTFTYNNPPPWYALNKAENKLYPVDNWSKRPSFYLTTNATSLPAATLPCVWADSTVGYVNTIKLQLTAVTLNNNPIQSKITCLVK